MWMMWKSPVQECMGWHASSSRFSAASFPWPMYIISITPSCLASLSPNSCPKHDRFVCHSTECVKNREWLVLVELSPGICYRVGIEFVDWPCFALLVAVSSLYPVLERPLQLFRNFPDLLQFQNFRYIALYLPLQSPDKLQ
jgi:hypothetical protein